MEVEEVEQAEADLPFSSKIRGFQWLSEEDDSEPPKLRGFHQLSEISTDVQDAIFSFLLKGRSEATLSPRPVCEVLQCIPPELSPISNFEEWMQHVGKPRRLMSLELMNLITTFLPSKKEEWFQLEKQRERLISLKETLVSLKEGKRMGEQIRFAFNGYTEFVEKQIKVAEKRIRWMYCDKGDGAVSNAVYPILKEMAWEQYHNALNILDKFHSRYPHDPKISQLLEKIQRMSGFLLGVVVIFIYQYLMGYVETGRWNTYSNGAWEFRATYVCIELRLGSYPFQKFRERQEEYWGVSKRPYPTRNGVTFTYKPWVSFRGRGFCFKVQKTVEKAARIRDVAKFWLKIKGGHPYNFGEEDYNYLNFVQEFHPQQSDSEIKRLVLEHAQRFLTEFQQSQEVPIVYQPPDVGPAGFANCEHIDNTIEGFVPFGNDDMFHEPQHLDDYEINDMVQELQHLDADEQRTDMIQEPQSVSANLEFAGPALEENVGEGHGVFALSVDPSLSQPRCTSRITLMAPCNCIAYISDVEVFLERNGRLHYSNFQLQTCPEDVNLKDVQRLCMITFIWRSLAIVKNLFGQMICWLSSTTCCSMVGNRSHPQTSKRR